MRVYGVTMVRDEADIVETTLRHMAAECDHLVVGDHLSTDGTSEILERLAGELPITVHKETDPAYLQSERMTRYSVEAAAAGADWVIPFDIDEIWYTDQGTIRQALEACPEQIGVLSCPGFDHIARSDGLWSPWRRVQPQTYPKVMFRASEAVTVHKGNHGCDHPGRVGEGPFRYRHFQYRSLEQYKRKVRQGAKAVDIEGQGPGFAAHWRADAKLSDMEIHARWLMLSSESGLVFDPAPVRRPVTVAVVIPTLDPHSEMIAACTASLGVEATVVHDDQADGFAATCNRGAKDTLADVLVFLNDDTIAHPGWLDALTRRIGWGIVGGLLTYPDGTVQHSGVFFRRDGQGRLEAFNALKPLPSGEVPAVTGACLAVTRELWDELGGFDESYRNGYEDVDLCLRARDAGSRVFLAADCDVTHLESQSDRGLRFGHAQQNIALMQERWGDLTI